MNKAALLLMLAVIIALAGKETVRAGADIHTLEEVCTTIPGWWDAGTKTCTTQIGWSLYVTILRINADETLVNNATVGFLYGTLENYGTIINHGLFTNNKAPDLNGTGNVENYGRFINIGVTENGWIMINKPGAVFTNQGSVINLTQFENWGSFISCSGSVSGIPVANFGSGSILNKCHFLPLAEK